MSLARAPKSLAGTSSRRVQLILFAAAGVVILASCSSAGGNSESDSQVLPPSSASSSPAPSLSAEPGSARAAADTRTAIESVDWGDGRNTAGMEAGVPNPSDWYSAAFGRRTTEKIVYLTYDDGPWPPYTNQVLSLLAKNNAKATFFVPGNQAQQHPVLLDRIIAEGNALGNHTMTHADLVGMNRQQIRAELSQVERAVGPTLGPCMRPPYGLIDTKVASVSAKLGLMPILWTAHAQDWAPRTVPAMVKMLKKGTEPGAVVLLHDSANKEKTIEATRQMLPWWKSKGYRLETIPACRVS